MTQRQYELWDVDTGNIVGTATTLTDLVVLAYDLGRANPDLSPALSATLLESRCPCGGACHNGHTPTCSESCRGRRVLLHADDASLDTSST